MNWVSCNKDCKEQYLSDKIKDKLSIRLKTHIFFYFEETWLFIPAALPTMI